MLLLSIIAFINTNHSITEKDLIPLQKKQTLSTISKWYYVYFKSYKDISRIKLALPNLNISSLNIDRNCLTLFISTVDANKLSKLPNIRVYQKKLKKVTFSTIQENETYIVYAHSSFKAPMYSSEYSQHGPYSLIKTNQPTKIESDSTVISIKKVPKFHLMNRWTTGFLQSGDPNYIIKNGFYTSNRKYNDRGLNGSNVIVTLIDSGTDVNNCLFNDPKYPSKVYNETNMNHRKIVRYDLFTNYYNKVVRHGTHCAGIIAGSTDSFPMKLYNGQAPAAKLYVADIGYDDRESIDVSKTFYIFQQAMKLNSPIISCSWGDSDTTPDFTQMFDYLSYENPSHLFVFAAGNEFLRFRVGTPANSKNVLTIASSNPPRSYYLGDSTHIVKISDGKESIYVSSSNIFSSMQKYDISYLQNIEVIKYNENIQNIDYSNKAVIIYDSSNENSHYMKAFDYLFSNNAKVAIVFDVFAVNHDNLYVINAKSQDKYFFDTHNKINITIDIPKKIKSMTAADYSSKGPTTYGNRKPDIMAPGTYITSASSRKNSLECNAKISLTEMSGTSMATPAVSGSLALVYQYLNESIHGLPYDKTKKITSALLRCFAIAGSGDTADIEQGYGNLNLSRILVYPNLDFDFGLRYYSDKIIHNNFTSFFVKTDHVGSLSVSLAWIDVPINLQSLYPLFSYFEFYIIGPDGKVYSEEEQFSTMKKIVINNAPVGNYEIRLRMNQIVPSEYSVDYSLVIVGPFDHLNFMNNPSELKPITPKTCSPKCPVNKGFAHCNSETATCVCDKLHTGTNCEYEVFEISENKAVKHSLGNREFLYKHLDLSKYKNMKKTEIEEFTFSLKLKSDNYVYSNGLIRYFFNTDNKLPLSTPTYFIQLKSDVDAQLIYPLSDMIQMEDVYLTIFNDYGINISFSINWTVKQPLLLNKNSDDKIMVTNDADDSSKQTSQILILALIIIGCVAIVSIIVFLIVKTFKNKNIKKHGKNSYQQYTDVAPNNQLNVTLIDEA